MSTSSAPARAACTRGTFWGVTPVCARREVKGTHSCGGVVRGLWHKVRAPGSPSACMGTCMVQKFWALQALALCELRMHPCSRQPWVATRCVCACWGLCWHAIRVGRGGIKCVRQMRVVAPARLKQDSQPGTSGPSQSLWWTGRQRMQRSPLQTGQRAAAAGRRLRAHGPAHDECSVPPGCWQLWHGDEPCRCERCRLCPLECQQCQQRSHRSVGRAHG